MAIQTEGEGLDFAEFFARENVQLGRAIFLLTGDRTEAEDLVQEALARAYERWDRVSRMDEPAGYVYRIASNLHRRRTRIRGRLRALFDPRLHQGTDPLAGAEARLDLIGALAELPHDQREALILVEMLGYDADTASRILGIKAVSVRVRLHRARTQLRELLGDEDA